MIPRTCRLLYRRRIVRVWTHSQRHSTRCPPLVWQTINTVGSWADHGSTHNHSTSTMDFAVRRPSGAYMMNPLTSYVAICIHFAHDERISQQQSLTDGQSLPNHQILRPHCLLQRQDVPSPQSNPSRKITILQWRMPQSLQGVTARVD